MSNYISDYQSIYISISISVYVSVYVSVYLSISISVYISVYQSIYVSPSFSSLHILPEHSANLCCHRWCTSLWLLFRGQHHQRDAGRHHMRGSGLLSVRVLHYSSGTVQYPE